MKAVADLITEARVAKRAALDELALVSRRQHADTPAAARRLNQHREADRARRGENGSGVSRQHAGALGHRHAVLGRQLARPGLVPHRLDPAWRRPDEARAGFRHPLRERGVFREKAVTGVQPVRARFAQHLDQGILVEIARARRRGPDGMSLACHLQVRRPGVRLRIHRHRADAHLVQRAQHTGSNRPAIGNDNFAKHEKCVIRES